MSAIRVGVDASRNRSGGAIEHLSGILQTLDPGKFGIEEVNVWAYQSLLDSLPDRCWLKKHPSEALEGSLLSQLTWQALQLEREAASCGCDILFSTDASTLCRFKPMVILSQDLLSYEPGIIKKYGWSRAALRLWAILKVQNAAFRHASGTIFLTRYSRELIQESCGVLRNSVVIPHGVDSELQHLGDRKPWPSSAADPVQCLYISNAALYKNQWTVVRAVELLRERGHNITLSLIGGGTGKAQALLDRQIQASDPAARFVQQLPYIPHEEVGEHLASADLFIFASSCETFGITLVEAMAAGIPITCSNKSSLPETLGDGGVYFDPEDVDSIISAVERVLLDSTLRRKIVERAKALAQDYTWTGCAAETWSFIINTYSDREK